MNKLTSLKRYFLKGNSVIVRKLRTPSVPTNIDMDVTGDASMLKRLITPTVVVDEPDHIQIGDEKHSILAMVGIPGTMKPNWMYHLINDASGRVDFSQHISPIDNDVAMKKIEKSIDKLKTSQELARIEKKELSLSEASQLGSLTKRLASIQRGEERMFDFATYFSVHADDERVLETNVASLWSALQGIMIKPERMVYRNTRGHMSMMPVGIDDLETARHMDTTSAAMTIALPGRARIDTNPTAETVIWEHASGMPIHINRFDSSMMNYNMAVFASSGSGKSFMISLFIMRDLETGKDVIIIDPKGEYSGLVAEFNGENIIIQEGSPTTMNPFDLGRSSLSVRKQSLPAFFEMLTGGVTDAGKSILDTCINVLYETKGITNDRSTWNKEMPTIGEFYEVLASYINGRIKTEFDIIQSDRVAAMALASKVKRFADGGTYESFFNGQTSIKFDGKLINYDISNVPADVQNAVMYMLMSSLYEYMSESDRGFRSVVIDEAWAILASNSIHVHNIIKTCRFKKMGLILVTQDLADVMKSGVDEAIINNVALTIVMRIATAYSKQLGSMMGLTMAQAADLPGLERGEGYLISGKNAMKFKTPPAQIEKKLIEASANGVNVDASAPMDMSKDIHRCRDLTHSQIEHLTDPQLVGGAYTRVNGSKIIGRGTADFMIRNLPSNQSPEHFIMTHLIAEIGKLKGLKTTINDNGMDCDVMMELPNSYVIGFEYETGKNNRSDVMDKTERLDLSARIDKWWFVTSSANLKEYADLHLRTVTSGKVEQTIVDNCERQLKLI
jgi:hypothetical protein